MIKKIQLLFVVFITFCTGVLAQNNTNKNAFEKYIKEAKTAEQEMNATKACIAYEKALHYCRNTPSISKKLPTLLYQYGSVLMYAGEYTKALDALEESVQINIKKEKIDTLLEARTYMQLGVLNFFQEHWDESLYYYKKAKDKALEMNNKQGLSIAINNIANVYQKKGNYTQAISGYTESLALQQKIKDTATICNTYFNLGTCYKELQQEKKALHYFNKSHTLATAINDIEIQTLSLTHQAEIATDKGNYKKAKILLNEAERIAKKLGYRQVLVEILEIKTKFYKQQGNYKSAFNTYVKKQSILDSIANEKINVRTKELKVKLETKEKENKIRKQKIKIDDRNKLLKLLGLLSLIGLIFTYVIFRLWKSRKKQNVQLKQLNKTKDKLFSIISHDLKAPAIAQKMAIDHLRPKVEALKDDKIKKYCKILHENTENQIIIIRNLLSWASVQSERIKYDPKAIDIVPIINDEIKLYSVPAKDKSISLTANLPKECVVFIDKQMMSIVIRNLINNAVKFTNVGGHIFIHCECVEDDFVFSITDNGIGMTSQQIKALYTSSQNIDIKFGTNGEKGTGLGLILCKDLLERNNSRLLIESKLQKGTTMRFTLQRI